MSKVADITDFPIVTDLSFSPILQFLPVFSVASLKTGYQWITACFIPYIFKSGLVFVRDLCLRNIRSGKKKTPLSAPY